MLFLTCLTYLFNLIISLKVFLNAVSFIPVVLCNSIFLLYFYPFFRSSSGVSIRYTNISTLCSWFTQIKITTKKPSLGIDELVGQVIQAVLGTISGPLLYIINISFTERIFLYSLKMAKSVQIYAWKGLKTIFLDTVIYAF